MKKDEAYASAPSPRAPARMKPVATASMRAKKPATNPARMPLVPWGAPSASAGNAHSADAPAAAAPNSAARDWFADTTSPTPHIAPEASA